MRYSKINRKQQRLIDENNELKNEINSLKDQKSKIYGILDSLMHEMRRLNLEIVSASEDLSKCIANKNYNLSKALSDVINLLPQLQSDNIYILATYTALLQLRELLIKENIIEQGLS